MASKRIKGITIEIDGNVSPLQKSLKSLDSSISHTQSELRDVNKLLKLDPSNTELLTQKQGLLGKAVDSTKDRLKQLREAQAQMVDANGNVRQGMEEQYNALSREIVDTEGKLKSLEKQQKDFGSVAQQQWAAVGKEITNTGKKISDVSSKISGFGDTLTKYVTTSVTALGAAAVTSFNKVDGAMDTVVTKTGATGEALAEMQQTVEDIATSIPTDLDTAANAVGELNTRFGVTGTELQDLSESFIKFASLNNTDVTSSIDSVQKALSAYGLSSKDAQKLLDVLNRTSQNTGASVDTLTSGLVDNAAAFQSMGLSIDQSVALMGQMEKSGVDSSKAMTALQRAMKTAASEGKPLSSVLADMQEKILSDTEAQESLTEAYDVFGRQAAPEVYNAIRQGTLDLTSYADAADITADSMDSVNETFEATVDPTDQLQEVLNELMIAGSKLGEALMPFIQKIVDVGVPALESVSDALGSLSPETQDLIVKIGLAAAAAGPLVKLVGSLGSGIGSIVSTVGKLIPLLAGPQGLIVLAGAAAGLIAVGALTSFNDEFNKTVRAAKDLDDELESSASSRKEAMDDVEASGELALQLRDKIERLQEQTSLTADEQDQMASAVAQLNTLYPDLNLQIDESTGKLQEESAARLDNVDAMIQEARAAAAQESLTEIAQEQIEVEKQLNELYEQQKTLSEESVGHSTEALGLHAKRVTENVEAIKELQDRETELSDEQKYLTDIIGESTTKLDENTSATQTNTDAMEEAVPTAEEVDSALEDLKTQYEETAETAYDSAMSQGDAFEELKETSETSLDDMITNLQANAQAYQNYAENLGAAMEWAANSTDENAQDLVQYIADMGTDGAGYLQELVDAVNSDDERLDELLSSFGDYQENVADYSESMAEMKTTTSNTTDEIESQFKTAGEKVAKELSNMSSTVSGTKFTLNSSNWHIQTPHFYAKRKAILNSYMSAPVVDVDWYAKAENQPYVFDSPTVIGVGDVPEVVVGKDKYDQMVNNNNNATYQQSFVFNITQEPGEDSESFAQRVKDVFVEETQRTGAAWA